MPPADDGAPSGVGTSGDPADATPVAAAAHRSRIRRIFSASRDLSRVVYRDPEHVPERLTLYTTGRLADPAREWAQSMVSSHPDTPVAKIAEGCVRTRRTSRGSTVRSQGLPSSLPSCPVTSRICSRRCA